MKILFKTIGILFLLIFVLVGIWFSLDTNTKCKFMYGKNICNFYEMMDIANKNPSISDFDKMTSLCKEMSDVPKKDSCFEFIAEIFSRIDIGKAQQSCEEIKGFDGVHNKEDCYIKVQKSTEEKLAESTVVEFMNARLQRNTDRASFWLSNNARLQYSQPGLTLIGTSNPHFESFEILEIDKRSPTQFEFKVRIYEEYTGEGRIGYFDENLIVNKDGDKYLIDSVERG